MNVQSGQTIICLHPRDNVAVAIERLNIGTVITGPLGPVTVREAVKIGHKIALSDIAAGESVVKYGQVIGLATVPISPGTWVHSPNLANRHPSSSIEKCTAIPVALPSIEGRTFQGYRRADGRAGTRNYVGVISTVNCSASVARAVARQFDTCELQAFPNIDGVVAFTHGTGCGMPYDGPSHRMLNRVLAGIAKHPNIGAFLLIGLGCEQNTLGYLTGEHQLLQINQHAQAPPVPVMTIQDQGGTRATIAAATQALRNLLPHANDVARTTIPASEIVLATECGGSDAYSGITANPAVGAASDRIVACGGTTILAETTEVYGAEHLLTRRARTVEVADRLLAKIEWWKWYAGVFGAEIDNNPSPGNKEGGLTTIAEKSLGAIAKGGSTALEAVYEYAEQVRQRGFVFMDSPGFDPPSVTGMVAGGANVAIFTTGRGSCFGCKPTPCIKVATNSPMYERLQADMDVNAGIILAGTSVDQVGELIFELILEVAGGRQTLSEEQGLGDEEFVPWTVGPVL